MESLLQLAMEQTQLCQVGGEGLNLTLVNSKVHAISSPF